jgi:micrococcal nuclease
VRRAALLVLVVALAVLGGRALTGVEELGRPEPGDAALARVVWVVDGDTIRVRDASGREERVRYIGVDAPETEKPGAAAECYAERAAAFNAQLVADREVRLVRDAEERDRYGRLLAYVHVGHTDVGEALLRGGYAQPLTVPPNVRHAERFRRLAAEARRAGRGLWASCAS